MQSKYWIWTDYLLNKTGTFTPTTTNNCNSSTCDMSEQHGKKEIKAGSEGGWTPPPWPAQGYLLRGKGQMLLTGGIWWKQRGEAGWFVHLCRWWWWWPVTSSTRHHALTALAARSNWAKAVGWDGSLSCRMSASGGKRAEVQSAHSEAGTQCSRCSRALRTPLETLQPTQRGGVRPG